MTERQAAYNAGSIARVSARKGRPTVRQVTRLAERLDKALARGDRWRTTAFSTRDEYNYWFGQAAEGNAKIAELTKRLDAANRHADCWRKQTAILRDDCARWESLAMERGHARTKLIDLNALLVADRDECLALAGRYEETNRALKREITDLQTVIALQTGANCDGFSHEVRGG